MSLLEPLADVAQVVAIVVAVVATVVGVVALRRRSTPAPVSEPPPLRRLLAWTEAQKLARRRAERRRGPRPPAQPAAAAARRVLVDGGAPEVVSGCVHRRPAQDVLARSARRGQWEREATLVREPDNWRNAKVVSLHVEEQFVGCLPREKAEAWAGLLAELPAHDVVACCRVLIVPRADLGGREVLDVIHYLPSMPPTLAELLDAERTTATA